MQERQPTLSVHFSSFGRDWSHHQKTDNSEVDSQGVSNSHLRIFQPPMLHVFQTYSQRTQLISSKYLRQVRNLKPGLRS